jgi:TolB-like protein/cytochrome c-type biogenesis protein CcmH/NrfG
MASAAISALMALSIVGVVLLQLGATSAAISALVAVSVVGVVFLKLRNRGTESALTPTLPPPSAPVVAGTTASDKSIAVLPFVDMSEKKDQEYFSDGLTEELINHLTQYADLKVIARTSSFYFKGKNEDIPTIAKRLLVANVLAGSVRKSGKALRITAQLIRADDGTQLWSQTYDRTLANVFGVQEDVSKKVVQALKVALLDPAVPQTRAKQGTAAYTQVMQARVIRRRATEVDASTAVDYLHKAIEVDPELAIAWAELARTLVWQSNAAYMPMDQVSTEARYAAKTAIALDPQLAAAHFSLGLIAHYFDWDWAVAESEYQQALELEPRNIEILNIAAELAHSLGRSGEARNLLLRAIALDPLDERPYYGIGSVELLAGSLAEAEVALRKALDLNPNIYFAQTLLGQVLLAKGAPQDALKEFERASSQYVRLFGQALAYYRLGRKEDADLALAEMEEKYAAKNPFGIAQICAYRGEFDKAISWFDRAYRQKDPDCLYIKVDIFVANLRSDPRYKVLLRKMKLPE